LFRAIEKSSVQTIVRDKFLRAKEAARYVRDEGLRVHVKVFRIRTHTDTSERVRVHMYARQTGDRRNDRKRATIPSGSTLPGRHVTIAEIELQ